MIVFDQHPESDFFATRERRAHIVLVERASQREARSVKPSAKKTATQFAARVSYRLTAGGTPTAVHTLSQVPAVAVAVFATAFETSVGSFVSDDTQGASLTVPLTEYISVARFTSSEPFPSVAGRIDRFVELKDGWNGRNSLAPNKTATEFARQIAEVFAEQARWLRLDAEPQVAPLDEGGYQFEWRNGARELLVSINNDARMSLLEVEGEREVEHEASIYTGLNNYLKPALSRFLRF